MSDVDAAARTVPFGPWKTFKSFVESDLKAKTVPASIDGSLFRGKSGTDARQLRSALRFYRLVEGDDDKTTARLRTLVAAYGTDGWKTAVNDLLSSYDSVLQGVDLANGTQGQLEEAFRARGDVTGSTLKKAVRLYLAIAAEAGKKLSPHFVAVRAGSDTGAEANTGASNPAAPSNGNGARAKRKRASRQTGGATSNHAVESPPSGVDAIQPLPGCDFRVWVPKDLTKAQLDFAMSYLKNWLKLMRADLA